MLTLPSDQPGTPGCRNATRTPGGGGHVRWRKEQLMPDTPDQQTRAAVEQRIHAHVRRGWPDLDDIIVTHRGPFCYLAATLPGHHTPRPILRLRYQGSPDRWDIAIHLASTERYSESELPGARGPTTGTPEHGIDITLGFWAGPPTHIRSGT